MTTGERLALLRRTRGWSYRKLSRASGVAASKLHRIEHNEQEPKYTEVELIVTSLGWTMAHFRGDAPIEVSA